MSGLSLPLNRSMRTFFNPLAALLLAGAALFASADALADPPGRVGRVAETEGALWTFDPEQNEWISARRNRPVTSGDRLSAERNGRAELQIGSATVRLDGDSELEIVELDDDRVRLHLHRGALALRLRSNESAREFSVSTATGRFDPQRAGHYRIDQSDNGTFGGVLVGSMRFEARDSTLELAAGQRAEFWVERGATHYSWAPLPADRFADWVARDDRRDERDAQRRPYVSAEMTGAEDLDRYGDWDRHPEYGALWLPRRVEPGWAPYRYGHWAHVRPWGWTWVDDAPWGFAPFHYGRWISWQGRWAWAPGQYVARPVYAPALVAWIGGSNVSIGVNIGGPSVGWVPLAPRDVYVPYYSVSATYVQNVNTPYRRWHPPLRPGQPVPTGPIMYSNQGVPGGVTVVSQNVLRERRPITSAVVVPVDARTVARWQNEPLPGVVALPPGGRNGNGIGNGNGRGNDRRGVESAPPPPVMNSPVAMPGAAAPVPNAPGGARGTPWGQVPGSRGAGRPNAAAAPAPAPISTGGDAAPGLSSVPVQNAPPPGRPPLSEARGRPPGQPQQRPEFAAPPPQREMQEQRGRGRGEPPGRAVQQAPMAAQAPQAAPVAPLRPAAPVGVGAPVPPTVVQQPAPVQAVPAPPNREEPSRGRGRNAEGRDDREDRQPPGQERRRERQQNQ